MIPLRLAREYVYHLHHVGERPRLAEALARIPVFMVLCDGETRYDLLRYWVDVGDAVDIEAAYAAGLQQWRSDASSIDEIIVLGTVARVFEDVGRWNGSIALHQECLALAIERGDRSAQADARCSLGQGYQLQGVLDTALDELTNAHAICIELGDRSRLSGVLAAIGVVHSRRGEYDKAMEYHRQSESLCRQLGDRRGLARAIGGIGVSHYYHDDFDRALECFRRQEAINRELGDRSALAAVIGNIGNVYNDGRHEYDRALECYRQQAATWRELGNPHGLSNALGNSGWAYYMRKEYDRALECFRQQETICRELGDRGDQANALDRMGDVQYEREEYDQALECYLPSEAFYREIGNRRARAQVLGKIGRVHAKHGKHDRALERLHEAVSESRVVGDRWGLSFWLGEITTALIDLLKSDSDAMPPYLSAYVSDTASESWRDGTLRMAREHAEEGLAIATVVSAELGRPELLLNANEHMVRVEVAEGNGPAAITRLEWLLARATSDEGSAEWSEWKEKLMKGDSGSRTVP